jgi:hypothetical protein
MKTARDYLGTFHFDGNVVRWNTNDAIPFSDVLDVLLNAGYITRYERDRSIEQRKVEDRAVIEDYKRRRAAITPEQAAEEAFERRAAFGPGETVVDLITGQTYTS